MSQPEASPPLSQMVVRSECHSRSSRSSRRSSTSQAAARARAEAEAARTRAQYAKRQIDMEVEKARIEATLNALKKEGEAEAALAAAHVLEAAADEEHDAVDLTEQGVSSKTPPSIRRAQDYVNAHFADCSLVVNEDRKPDTGQPVGNNDAQHLRQSQPPVASSPGGHLAGFVDQEQPKSPPIHRKTDISTLPQPSLPPKTELSDFTAYLARRDLLTAGFKVFDNRPESYLSWKSIFHNAIEGLNLKSSEELDLLTKWLSGESLQHALRIRAVHVNNPHAGLQRLWQRLDKSFGSPETIEMRYPPRRLCRLTRIYTHSLHRSLLWTQPRTFSSSWAGTSSKLTRFAVRPPPASLAYIHHQRAPLTCLLTSEQTPVSCDLAGVAKLDSDLAQKYPLSKITRGWRC
ncbi:uncharacterized protein LOC106097899 isoform X4 [Oreochromis niloticus]|uniref:uncharacterized protein LOC106097899 isoform X4 n=1 Tax=Oreochromis niloticus TaxID=8128 RepID=UPI000DF1C35D|nr:uncharacterized protein LOC106097899 isoform X4 [Oreochromis niloticus]